MTTPCWRILRARSSDDLLKFAQEVIIRDFGLPQLPYKLRLSALGHRPVASEGGHHLFVAEILAPGLELLWR